MEEIQTYEIFFSSISLKTKSCCLDNDVKNDFASVTDNVVSVLHAQ